jgi:alginate O-acetyltransferase complex protein AlgI
VNVPSFQFFAFVLVGAALYNSSKLPAWRQAIWLIANLSFLASFSTDPPAFLPLTGFLFFGFLSVRVLQIGRAPLLFVMIVLALLLWLFWLKKYTFIPDNVFITSPYVTIGLSYVFFRVMHLVIDTHQRAIGSALRPIEYVNYTLNFTSLVSGPIQRYQDYRRMQYDDPLALDEFIIGKAIERMILGFFKVSVVSMVLLHEHKVAISAFDQGQPLVWKILTAMSIIAIYPIFLYFNFSGYTDAVIGSARLFRLELPENFDRPFTSDNFINFWSRWHITLSGWLKAYVYIPLLMGLMRRYESPRWEPYLGAFAFFVTFFLVGAWHGQTSEFLFFGVLQGAGVSLNKLYQIQMTIILHRKGYRLLCDNPLYRALSRGLTFTWFAFTLLWFWSDWGRVATFGQTLGASGIAIALGALVVGSTVILSFGMTLNALVDRSTLASSRYLRTAIATGELTVLTTLYVLLDSPTPEIVYKAF